jgi:hypothetical protein
MLCYGMNKSNCGSHAEKCNPFCHPHKKQCGLKLDPDCEVPLRKGAGCGYKEENWEDVLVIAEMKHAQEMRLWAERYETLDQAYKAKIRRLEREFTESVEVGFEEAYAVLQQLQSLCEEKDAEIELLKSRIAECCPECSPDEDCCKDKNVCSVNKDCCKDKNVLSTKDSCKDKNGCRREANIPCTHRY